jgi:hypothetical protein
MDKDIFVKVDPNNENGCVAIALSVALDKSTEGVINDLKKYGDNPRSELQWGKYLIDNGFHKVDIAPIPNQSRILLEKLTRIALPNQVLVCKSPEHIVTIKDRKFYDTIDNYGLCVFWYYTK